jgi:hypothetical protein
MFANFFILVPVCFFVVNASLNVQTLLVLIPPVKNDCVCSYQSTTNDCVSPSEFVISQSLLYSQNMNFMLRTT